MVLASRAAAWFVRNDDAGHIDAWAMLPGLHMVTAHDPDDRASPRVARHLPRFQNAPPPVPPDWSSWSLLLGDAEGPREAALSVPQAGGFGTACASLVGLPERGAPQWLFAAGPAGGAGFAPVALGGKIGGRDVRLL